MAKDYYNILGVSKNATQDEIKKAFRKLAHQCHPDKKGGDEAKFKEVNEAYQALGNPEKRKQYDQFGQTFGQGARPGGFGGMNWEDFARASGGGGQSQQSANFDFGDLGDMFGDLFGFGRSGGARRTRRSTRGNDIQAEMAIDFREAAFGTEKFIDLYKQNTCSKCSGNGAEPGTKIDICPTCQGSGQVQQVQRTILGSFQSVGICPECHGEGKKATKKCRHCGGDGRIKENEKFKVKIPAGINNGETIRLAYKGEAGARGGQAGDLFITMKVKQDPEFKRDDDNILSEVDVSFSQAALGDKISVNTLDGEIKLKIPSGTQSGKLFKLKEKGVPHLRSRGRGDHLVTVNVITPDNLTKQQKKLFEELANT
ncbi:molecular chaperone DnaJ [Patescibacteria group bacterium]|nr:molecular chaperone DnaJ [Patescibacteria group bacterium]